jgi:signal transduction histidine kinase/CheY-like chemotaxis protein
MGLPLLKVALRGEGDVVAARQRARQLARHLGFELQDQARIATAISELARNVVQYAGQGRVDFELEGRTAPQLLVMRVADEGPGIPHLDVILSGRYQSQTGMGVGMVGARRLMDQFHVSAPPGHGTTVTVSKFLPRSRAALDPAATAARVSQALAAEGFQNPLAEVQYQNQELIRALAELRTRQEELLQLNRELDDTNRGVVALYAELDEKAEHLRRADEMKTRFLSNMSHEFRTPLNAILAIGRLLQQRSDGDLTSEQEKQVGFVLKAAEDLTQLVDDLLDLAKVEAGKIVVRPTEFEVAGLFGALRGMLRPLLVSDTVRLVFDEAEGLPPLYTDEAKVSQVLRNFISNALKFTEKGEIRVMAGLDAAAQEVTIAVADTGIGIAPSDQARIFEEFGQVEHAMQKKVKGTGLGLALSRRLAEVLGGRITLQSAVGVGSTFSLHLPLLFTPAPSVEAVRTWVADPGRIPVLVVENDTASQHVYERHFRGSPFQPLPARALRDARAWLASGHPRAVVLDVLLFGEDTWSFLGDLKSGPATRHLPVVVATNVDDERKALALGADVYIRQPVEREWLLSTLARLTAADGSQRVVIVDDDDAARYVLAGLCRRMGLDPLEFTDGTAMLARVKELAPRAVVLDLMMPALGGDEILGRLRSDSTTSSLPVVIATSKLLEQGERAALEARHAVVLSKARLSSPDAEAMLQEALQQAEAAVGS